MTQLIKSEELFRDDFDRCTNFWLIGFYLADAKLDKRDSDESNFLHPRGSIGHLKIFEIAKRLYQNFNMP